MVDWITSNELVDLADAVTEMERRVALIASGKQDEAVWLLEHPPVITMGTSGKESDVLDSSTVPVFRVSRGGQVTFHGPGQRVAYLMLNLARRGRDIRRFVHSIERWIVLTLAEYGIRGETRCDRIGVWVPGSDGREEKIAAIGIRLRRWVSFHGVSINVAPDLCHYASIVPCGVRDHGNTSMAELGVSISMDELDGTLKEKFRASLRRLTGAPEAHLSCRPFDCHRPPTWQLRLCRH